MRRITFITGYYGSGKTEIALNLAVNHQVQYLFDLDIINPYFRSREFKGKLGEHIEVVASDLKDDEYMDLPYLSKKIFLPFNNPQLTAIYDLGGSDLGVKVMRQFSKENLDEVDVYLVINIYRLETNSVPKMIALVDTLELEGGMHITGLINNSNLLKETTIDEIKQGEAMINEVSKQKGIPVVYTCVAEDFKIEGQVFAGELMVLKRYLSKSWRS